MSVYFITCRDVNMVKIGYSDRVRARLTSLRVACPLDIKLELMLPGGSEEEKKIHGLLKKDRVRGEWFWITDTVERFINNPPPPPRECADLDAPYTDLAQHERMLKRLRQAERERARPLREEARRLAAEVALSESRAVEAAEKELAAKHHSGNRLLAKLERAGAIHFPFRAKETA